MGKLPLPAPPETYLVEQRNYHRIASLDLNEKSVALANLLPLQRDPFDRMLICQALDHRMTIATVERTIRNYPVYVI